jgi:hypothetical protein
MPAPRMKGFNGRKVTYEQLIRMSDQEVAEYWTNGVLPAHLEMPVLLPTAQGRSALEAAERRWARGDE